MQLSFVALRELLLNAAVFLVGLINVEGWLSFVARGGSASAAQVPGVQWRWQVVLDLGAALHLGKTCL